MKHTKTFILGILSAGFMSAVTTTAYGQNSEFTSTAIKKRSTVAAPLNRKDNATVVELKISELRDITRLKGQALASSLRPKIQQAAERQGIKSSKAEILEASDKLATVLSNADLHDLGKVYPGISIRIKITLSKPVKLDIEIKL